LLCLPHPVFPLDAAWKRKVGADPDYLFLRPGADLVKMPDAEFIELALIYRTNALDDGQSVGALLSRLGHAAGPHARMHPPRPGLFGGRAFSKLGDRGGIHIRWNFDAGLF